MVKRLNSALYGLLIFFFVAITGCSSSATKSGPSPTPSKPPENGASEKGKPPAGSESRLPGGPSGSLGEAQRGQAQQSSPLKEIYFDFDRSDLRADARGVLKANADWLKANPTSRVEIEGHCDERGTTEYNLALGAKRAQAAKDYLVTLGISAERLSTISYGKELPICKEQSEDCLQKNRRDRFVIIPARPAS